MITNDPKREFKNSIFKLMNKSVYGKCMENVKTNMTMNLTTQRKMANTYFSKNTFKSARYNDGLYVVNFYKKEII